MCIKLFKNKHNLELQKKHYDEDFLLTVYVLTYNHEKTIKKTLESVLSQKTHFKYKIIILEDCSTDNTLEICRGFQKKYPQIIDIIAQPVNTKCKHSLWAKKKISTKYWCTIEGDDYWCDNYKIEKALRILENNEEYVGFGHDTECINEKTNCRTSVFHGDISKINTKKEFLVNLKSIKYIHTSAIIYRHIVDFNYWTLPLIDTYILYYHLSLGYVFCYDKVMSVHPQTGSGIWSSLSVKQRSFNNEYIHFNINRFLKYKYNDVFLTTVKKRKIAIFLVKHLGNRIGWQIYICYRYIDLLYFKFFRRKSK